MSISFLKNHFFYPCHYFNKENSYLFRGDNERESEHAEKKKE